MEVLFHTASPSHYQSIADIYNYYIEEDSATMDEVHYTHSMIADWVKAFDDRERLFVATLADQVIGWGIIKKYSDRGGYRYTCETAVYLLPDYIGKGYGSAFKRYIMEQCKELDYKHLVAKIWADNTASIEYNLKLGYTIVGRQHKIGYKNGKWINVVIMQCLL